MKLSLQFFLLITLIFFYGQLSLGQSVTNDSVATGSNNKAELQALIIRYLGFCEKKDLKAMAAMWSPRSPVLDSRRQIWQKMFTIES